MVKGHAKGSEFERKICKRLSKWWDQHAQKPREDIFWRTAGSGAMAKTRSKTGGAAFGQYGDIQAIDPIGQPLIDFCSLELKKGYPPSTMQDMVDKKPAFKAQMYETFFEQSCQDSQNAGSPFWLCIIERNRREPLVFIPIKMKKALEVVEWGDMMPRGGMRFYGATKAHTWNVFYTSLSSFLKHVHPVYIQDYMKWHGSKTNKI